METFSFKPREGFNFAEEDRTVQCQKGYSKKKLELEGSVTG